MLVKIELFDIYYYILKRMSSQLRNCTAPPPDPVFPWPPGIPKCLDFHSHGRACHHVALIKCTPCLWLTLNTLLDLVSVLYLMELTGQGSHPECLSFPVCRL